MRKFLLAALLFTGLSVQAEMPEGDAARGEKVFWQCRTCHYPEEGLGHNNGPSLWNIFGREVGSQEGFEYYSDALKQAKFVWTPELMDVWIANPDTFLFGNIMMARPVTDAQDRADLIEYLKLFAE